VISTTSGSRVAISSIALTSPFQISSNQLHHEIFSVMLPHRRQLWVLRTQHPNSR
jgi:hypothetical protein